MKRIARRRGVKLPTKLGDVLWGILIVLAAVDFWLYAAWLVTGA